MTDEDMDWLKDYKPKSQSEVLQQGTRALFDRHGQKTSKGPFQVEADLENAGIGGAAGFVDALSQDTKEAQTAREQIALTLNSIHTHKGPQITPEDVPHILAAFLIKRK